MSTNSKIGKKAGRRRPMTVKRFNARKGTKSPLVCLTAYSAPMAEILDPHVDMLLVGDSASTVVHGHKTTIPITLDQMISHGQSVVSATESALVIIDMPFGSYEQSPAAAFKSAARIMKETMAAGVKLEGGVTMAPTIKFLVERGVPVMAHIGLQPQSVNAKGLAATGRKKEEWDKYRADAAAVAQAGAFAVVLEAMAEPLARLVTQEIDIPTIGIGASAACDGQILVTDDLLGLFPKTPSFVKRYAELRSIIEEAVKAYSQDVKGRKYPDESHIYDLTD